MLTLYQFTYSHFCEKVRWALDYKQLPYQPHNLLAGPHLLTTKKLAPKTAVPILIDGETVIQDSAEILNHLDTKWPAAPLTPSDPILKKEALEWETYLDTEIGVPIRLYFYNSILSNVPMAKQVMLRDAPWYGPLLYRFIFPVVRGKIRESLGVSPEAAVQAKQHLEAAFAKLNQALIGKNFLVGDCFSRADLTACSLLAMFCLPQQTLPDALETFRTEHEQDRFFPWVAQTYQTYRHHQHATQVSKMAAT